MDISILQWNIWYKENPYNIVEFLKANKADVVCLQEMTINSKDQKIKDVPAFIAQRLGYNYYHKEISYDSADEFEMKLANGIFSRFPIIKSTYTWINEPTNSGGYDDEYRAYVEVVIDINGQNLTIGTTHMSYTHRFESTPNKLVETNLLIKELEKHTKSYVFTGDLNALPGSATINSIASLLQNAGPNLVEKTWTTKPFSYNGFEETNLNWRLDYIFTSKDMNVISSEILKTDYSDHLPILTKIILP